MNQKTTRFNQDAFVAHDALPGNISQALSNEITGSGVRTNALPITSYTAGDTSGKPDSGLPEVPEAHTPKRISRKYIPLQSNGKSQDAVFPQSGDEAEFSWRPHGFQHDAFISVKDTKPNQSTTQEKGGPSREVMGLLKQLGHSDAGDVTLSTPAINNAIQEKAILVNTSPTNLANVEFNNHISTNTSDGRIHGQNSYSIQSEAVVNADSVFANRSSTRPQRSAETTGALTESAIEPQVKKTSENPLASKQVSSRAVPPDISNNTHTSGHVAQSNSDIYEQVRAILGEDKQGWKQVIKTAKSTTNNSTPNNTTTGNSTLASQENQIEQVIQKVLSQEASNRVELEHVLTHKFSSELTNMQQSMNKKIQDLREIFNNFMMR